MHTFFQCDKIRNLFSGIPDFANIKNIFLRRNLNLSRSTKVKLVENGQTNEYTISFDELEHSDLLGKY